LDEHLDVAFEVLYDMRFNSNFDELDIYKESNVIAEEISMYEDTPEELVYDILQAGMWQKNPLGYPTLGTKKGISQIDANAIRKYMDVNYHPENTVISIAGHFDRGFVLDAAERLFGCASAVAIKKKPVLEAVYSPCVVTKKKKIEQAHLVLGFPSIPIGSDKAHTLLVLSTVLGGGMSSRLFQKVREEHGLAYSVYSYNLSYMDTGVFNIYAALSPANMEKLIHMMLSEIKGFSLTEQQLTRTKEQIKSNYVMSLESSSNIMSAIGKSQLMLGRVFTPDEIIGKINAVTLNKIDALKHEMFDFGQMSVSSVGSISNADMRRMVESAV
jgi:predicted Zn-dependent peptidase